MADIVGTAYVRIKAITAGLGSEISDAFDKGMKDAQGDIDKSAGKAGEDSGKSYQKGNEKSFKGWDPPHLAMWDPPDASTRSEDAGTKHARSYGDGVDRETKRRNPFMAISDAFKKFSKAFNKDVDRDVKRKEGAFSKLFGALDSVADKIHIPKIAWGAILAPDILGGIASAIGAALAGITAALAEVVVAAAGAGVALGGIAAVALPGLAVLLAAFKVQTEELEKFKESAKDLMEPFKAIAEAAQVTLFPGLLDALAKLQPLIEILGPFASQIGGIVGGLASMMAGVLVDPSNMEALATILENSTKFFGTMGTAGVLALDAMMPLFAAMAPLANQVADSLLKMAENLNEFVTTEGVEGLTAKFQGWYDKFAQIARIVGDVFVGLWNIIAIAADSDLATGMFDGLEDAAQNFRDWTSSLAGENALKQWFADAQPFLHEAWLLLKDIADIVIGPVFEGDFSGPMEFVRTVREDWLPVFERLGEALSDRGIGDALLHLADALVGLLDATAGTGSFVTIIEGIARVIELLAEVMANPIVAEITKNLIFLAVGFKAIEMVIGPLAVLGKGGVLLGFAEGLIGLAGPTEAASGAFFSLGIAMAPVVAVLLALAAAVAAVWLTVKYWDDINAALAAAWEWFTKLSTPLQIVVGLLAGVAAIVMGPLLGVAAVIYGIAFAIKHWTEILDVLTAAWEGAKQFFTDFPAMIDGIGDAIAGLPATLGSFLTELPGMLAGLGESLSGLPDTLTQAASGVWEGFKAAVLEGLRDLPNTILDGLGVLADLGGKLIELIADGLQEALPALARFFAEFIPKATIWLLRGAGDLIVVGAKIIGFLAEGLIRYGPKVLVFFIKLPFEIMTLLRKLIWELIKFGGEMIAAMVEGLWAARHRILDFFRDLPGNILSAFVNTVQWLWETGGLILQGLVDGLQAAWPTILAFFLDLPGAIIGAIGAVNTWLVEMGILAMQGFFDGFLEVWASMNEFFFGIPTAIVEAIGDLFGFLWNGIAAGASAFGANIDGWVLDVVETLSELPGKAVSAIGDLAMTIWNAVSGGFSTAWSNVKTWVSNLVTSLGELPGKAITAIGNLGLKIWGAISAGFATVKGNVADWIEDVVTSLRGLPDKAVTAIGNLGTKIWNGIKGGFDTALTNVKGWVTDVVSELGKLPSKISGAITGATSGMSSAIRSVLRSAWNSAVDSLPSVSISVLGKNISFDPSEHLKMAMGGIIPGTAMGWPVIVGEGGRSEAIVPMERPGRALSVMQAAGLDKLVIDAYLHGQVPGVAAAAAGPTTMLAIDKAVFNAPVDADMVVQKITTAYRRMAS